MEVYKVDNLSFKYKNRQEYALKGVNFDVLEGDFVLLCGKSGCGKSTLLRILKQSIAPSGELSGKVSFYGKDIQTISDKIIASDIGFVLQNPDNQIVCDDVYGELCFGMSHLGYDQAEMKKRVFEIANYFGINHFLDMDISELSGGQRQLLAIGSILCQRPKVLLLDEPTSTLDPNSIQLLMGALERINRELGITIIMSEQELDDVYPICNRVIAMGGGEIAFTANKRDVSGHLNAYEGKDAFPVYVQAHGAFGDKDCPGNMKEARTWFAGLDIGKPLVREQNLSNGEVAVKARDLWLRFDKNARDVLKGVDINVHKGEFTSIFGANGSGKSTLLKVLCGLKKCYGGQVSVLGKKAMVGQHPLDLLSAFTVGGEFKRRDEELFCAFEIGELMSRHPYDLSGGEVKRVVLTKALMLDMDVLLLDEVTGGLGEFFKERLGRVLQDRMAKGLTVVMASHDLEFCARYASTCHLLFNGSIAATGPIRDVIADNEYYTTKARILTRGIVDGVVTKREVMDLCGRPIGG